ncbi:hypothetical protein AMATHDRAFT_9239 [Amanita thiersii Skay4041]|uniref:Uncharacterized protein n=1 Tax=Amanita thiersii Skay4041 TaxID=703135 RepID=A0A2A9N6B5_9AGAR|nr:hypothetical protein AMATHDRAFT_9239 [Amanita thiersii Skay4041]
MATNKNGTQVRGNHNTEMMGGPLQGHHQNILKAHQSPHKPHAHHQIFLEIPPEQELPGILPPLPQLLWKSSTVKLIIEFLQNNPKAFTFKGLVTNKDKDKGVPQVQPASLPST